MPYLVFSLPRLRDHLILFTSEHALQLVLVGLTTRCPCSPERCKFLSLFTLYVSPFCSLPITILCHFSFDSFTGIKLFKPHGPLLFSFQVPRWYTGITTVSGRVRVSGTIESQGGGVGAEYSLV